MKIAVIPGSYDPITFGHIDIIRRALPLFDEVIVAIGINSQKKNLFSLDERIRWIQEIFKDEPKVKVDHFEGLTLHFCQKVGAKYNTIATDLETLFFIAKPELSHISFTIVRELILGGGDISAFVPDLVSVKK